MSFVSIAEARALIKTGLNDSLLTAVIDRVEEEVTEKYGEPQDASLSVSVAETIYGGSQNLFVRRPIHSITSIVDDGTTLTADTNFRSWPSQGRIERLPSGTVWGTVCVVTYKPKREDGKWKSAIIELVRLYIEHTTMASESIGGEYSYSAPNWETERAKVFRRFGFVNV